MLALIPGVLFFAGGAGGLQADARVAMCSVAVAPSVQQTLSQGPAGRASRPQPGTTTFPVVWPYKISNETEDLALPPSALFGSSVAAVGDLDDDGVVDLAVGADGEARGTVRILFMERDHGVRSVTRLAAPSKIWNGPYGAVLCPLGDIDGDGVEDLAASSPLDCQVYVHRLNADGTIKSSVDIALTVDPPYLPGAVDSYGEGLACPGDLDGDGVNDLFMGCGVGFDGDDPRFYTVFLRPNGTVKGYLRTASAGSGGITCASVGDLDGDGIEEVAVRMNSVQIFFLNPNGTLRSSVPLPALGLPSSLEGIGDMDGDGIPDLAFGRFVGPKGDYALCRLTASGSMVPGSILVVPGPNGNASLVVPDDQFGRSLAYLGNFDGSGRPLLAIGARVSNDGGSGCGAVWIAELR